MSRGKTIQELAEDLRVFHNIDITGELSVLYVFKMPEGVKHGDLLMFRPMQDMSGDKRAPGVGVIYLGKGKVLHQVLYEGQPRDIIEGRSTVSFEATIEKRYEDIE